MKDLTLALIISSIAVGLSIGNALGSAIKERKVIAHACGECDHVAECGDYVCSVGVAGWHLKDGK